MLPNRLFWSDLGALGLRKMAFHRPERAFPKNILLSGNFIFITELHSPEVLQSICAPQPACRRMQGMSVSTVEGNGVHLRRQSAFHAMASHPPRAGGLQKVNHELENQIIISTFVRRTMSSDFYN